MRAPDPTSTPTSKFGTCRGQQLFKNLGPYGANPQQCDFVFGNDQGLLALRGVSIFTADCDCQTIYLGGDPRIVKGSGCETVPQSIATDR